jgi:hypothetical protein
MRRGRLERQHRRHFGRRSLRGAGGRVDSRRYASHDQHGRRIITSRSCLCGARPRRVRHRARAVQLAWRASIGDAVHDSAPCVAAARGAVGGWLVDRPRRGLSPRVGRRTATGCPPNVRAVGDRCLHLRQPHRGRAQRPPLEPFGRRRRCDGHGAQHECQPPARVRRLALLVLPPKPRPLRPGPLRRPRSRRTSRRRPKPRRRPPPRKSATTRPGAPQRRPQKSRRSRRRPWNGASVSPRLKRQEEKAEGGRVVTCQSDVARKVRTGRGRRAAPGAEPHRRGGPRRGQGGRRCRHQRGAQGRARRRGGQQKGRR